MKIVIKHTLLRTIYKYTISLLPPYYRALLYQLSALLPDSLFRYKHFPHSPVAMERIHITFAISALGNDTIKADTQPTAC